MEFQSVKSGLPEVTKIDNLVSDVVLFKINGLDYVGYYHSNGWFYCSEISFTHIKGFGKELSKSGGMPEDQKVTHWRYLRMYKMCDECGSTVKGNHATGCSKYVNSKIKINRITGVDAWCDRCESIQPMYVTPNSGKGVCACKTCTDKGII
jgi:hypothetical protein